MLVAVGLVVLMMSLFATIFQMSTSAMAVQKGIAENDQRSRLALTILRADLNNRTSIIVQPFEANEITATNPLMEKRKGYFYISENDRDDDTDDVLAFTVSAKTGEDLYYGRAVPLLPINPPGQPNGIANVPNQPEFDDGIVETFNSTTSAWETNNAGSSQCAEVCYFLRAGTLYRRVLLIRQPIKGGFDDGTPKLGSDGLGGGIPLTMYTASATAGTEANFWTEFDYSAYGLGPLATFSGPFFHSIADLSNENSTSNIYRLGKPNFRFGHSHLSGRPREYVGTNATTAFIGRFTHWETSYQPGSDATYTPMFGTAQYFGYPGRLDAVGGGNPMSTTPPASTLRYNAALGIVENYTLVKNGRPVPGPRAGEDILLTGVTRFDIKIWDEAASAGPDGAPGNPGDDNPTVPGGADDNTEYGWPGSDDGDFRDVGHDGATGFYRAAMADLGQLGGTAFIYCNPHPANTVSAVKRTLYKFDTWNPRVDLSNNNTGGSSFDPPPFHAPLDNLGFRRPLKAIQIRLTFFDVPSQQLRDVTFVQSLTD